MLEMTQDLATDAEQAQGFQYLAAYIESLLEQGGRPTRGDLIEALASAAGKIGELMLERNTDTYVVNDAQAMYRVVATSNGAVVAKFYSRAMANRRCYTLNKLCAR